VVLDQMASADPTSPEWAPMRDPYAATSPDGGDHFPVFVAKVLQMGLTGPTMTVDDLRRIDRPVLVMVGDDDAPTYEHTVTLFESLPQGQLAVVPGTSHFLPMEKPELVTSLILDFLAEGAPKRMSPIRFAPKDD
jgi:pimeloyl-ACP methyl ester carboxylesterase